MTNDDAPEPTIDDLRVAAEMYQMALERPTVRYTREELQQMLEEYGPVRVAATIYADYTDVLMRNPHPDRAILGYTLEKMWQFAVLITEGAQQGRYRE